MSDECMVDVFYRLSLKSTFWNPKKINLLNRTGNSSFKATIFGVPSFMSCRFQGWDSFHEKSYMGNQTINVAGN